MATKKGHYTIRALLMVLCGLLPLHTQAGEQMQKLSDKKLCADAECSYPILIARAIQDYSPADCRFIPVHQGQLVYVYTMLKDQGKLFWSGSVQGSYYGEQEARLGHFPSSVVEETLALMPAVVEVNTNFSHYFDTTYSVTYNKQEKPPINCSLTKKSRSFPGHQPELGPPHTKCVPTSCKRLDLSGHHSAGKS